MIARCLFRSGVAAAALALLAAPAFAAGQVTTLSVNGGALVRGAAPLPEFQLDFLRNEPGRDALEPPGSTEDFEISLTSPDNSVFHFLFSPRPQFGLGLDKLGGNRGYAGLTWNLFDTNAIFGNFALAGSYAQTSGAPNDPLPRPFGSPLMLHGALEFGYHIGDQHSLSLSIDEGRGPDLRGGTETIDNLRLRYGLKF